MSWIWNLLTKDLRTEIAFLIRENNKKDAEINALNSENIKMNVQINEERSLIREQDKLIEEEEFWNNKWSHNPIKYKAQGGLYRDIRTLINYPSYIASEVVLFDGLNKKTEEEILFAILKWCDTKIKYVSDSRKHGVIEYWNDSDISFQERKGDCEDKALMFKTLCLVCGIPDYRVKVVAGYVEDPLNKGREVGHAYPIVLIKGEWYTFDPTYYPDYTPIKDRVKHKNNSKYKEMWWAFTKEHCFSQKSVMFL